MPNVLNQRMLKELKAELEHASDCMVIDFTSVSVADVSVIRARLRQGNMRMKIVKTSLARRAAKELGFDGADDLFSGNTAILFGGESIGTVAKAFDDFTKEKFAKEKADKAPKIRGAFLEKKRVASELVAGLAKMPTRNQLLSEILGLLEAPLSGIAGILNTLMTDVPQLTQALLDQRGESVAPVNEGASPAPVSGGESAAPAGEPEAAPPAA